MKLKTVSLLIGVPSTTKSGLLLEKDASPLIVILEVDPTPVAPCVTVTPANLPCRLSRKLTVFTSVKSLDFIACTE